MGNFVIHRATSEVVVLSDDDADAPECSVPVLVLHVCACCKPQSIIGKFGWSHLGCSMASVIKHVKF